MAASVTSRKLTMVSVAVVALLFTIICESKSITAKGSSKPTSAKTKEDPMTALPSEPEGYTRQQVYLQPVGAQYTVVRQQPSEQPVYEAPREQPQQVVEYKQAEVQYVLNPTVQLVPAAERTYQKPTITQYVTVESQPQEQEGSARDYPGEIIYLGQNNEVLGTAPVTQEQPATYAQTTPELTGVAKLISRSSGMPATILTEVPVNEMPSEVLEKLKSDYGVKIVATRERPGANLVINCESYTHRPEGSICAKQPPPVVQVQPQASPYTYYAPDEEDQTTTYVISGDQSRSQHAYEQQQYQQQQPQPQHHPQAYSGETSDQEYHQQQHQAQAVQHVGYANASPESSHDSGHSVPAETEQPQTHPYNYSTYGSRTQPSSAYPVTELSAEAEPTAPSAGARGEHPASENAPPHDEASHPASGQAQAQPESDEQSAEHQSAGFEEQPKAPAAEEERPSKPSGEYYSGQH